MVNNTNKAAPIEANQRTIELTQSNVDAQCILDEFEDGILTTEGTTTYFEGFKALDLSYFSEIDYISDVELEEFESCKVKYNFSYDSESNIVTLSAEMRNELGEIEVETIEGYAFINANEEIDALMDVDGESILLSEMQDLGLIQNCGWFSRLFKKIAVAVVAVVAVAAAAAVIVSTAGLGMAAVIGVSATVGAIAGGVAGGIISYTEYGKLDWRWVVGGAVIGAALGAVTGWGVGTLTHATQTAQLKSLMKSAKNGNLNYSQTIINKGYINPNSSSYRPYVDNYNLISQEIMGAKNPMIESGTGYFKWTVEGAINGTKGYWELVIDPVKKIIVHFMFGS